MGLSWVFSPRDQIHLRILSNFEMVGVLLMMLNSGRHQVIMSFAHIVIALPWFPWNPRHTIIWKSTIAHAKFANAKGTNVNPYYEETRPVLKHQKRQNLVSLSILVTMQHR